MTDFLNQPGTPDLSSDQRNTIAETMAERTGMSAEQINEALGTTLDTSPRAEAQRQLSRLKNDPEWIARFERGDNEATELFNTLCATIALDPQAEAPALKPEDYRLPHHSQMQGQSAQAVEAWNGEFAQFASQLGLSQLEASQIAQIHLDGVARWSRMSEDERENYGHAQTAMLHSVLAKQGDPEAQIKAATNTLKLATGRDVDVARIARQVGSEQALELVIAAQKIARRQ